MQLDIVIREACKDDVDAVVALSDRLAEGTAPWLSIDGVQRAAASWVRASVEQSDADRAAFVAALDEDVAGFVSVVRRRPHWAGHDEGYIGELIVDRDVEGRGIGRRLVMAAENWLAERDVQRVALETGAANARALAAWRSYGYQDEQVKLSKSLVPRR